MPVTAGHVPGMTSDLRRVPMDPGRFHSGRWLVLAEGLLVSAFGVTGLVSAALHPHAGPTGAPVLGLATTPAHSTIMLALGVFAVAACVNRRAATIVTALSAVAYATLLFFGSIATARSAPTPLGFHAADVLLHGVLAAVNLGLLMWLIPDELGDEVWAPRRRRGHRRDRQQRSASDAVDEAAAARPSTVSTTKSESPRPAEAEPEQESEIHPRPAQNPGVNGQPSQPRSTNPPVSVRPVVEQSRSQRTNQPAAHSVENSTELNHVAGRATNAVLSPGVGHMALAVLAGAVGIVIWIYRR